MAFHNGTQEDTARLHFWGESRAGTQASRNKYTKKKKTGEQISCEILKGGGWWESTLGYTSVTIHGWTHDAFSVISIRWINRQVNQALSLGSCALLSQTYYLEHNIAIPVCFAAGLHLAVCLSLSVQICNTVCKTVCKKSYIHWLYSQKSKQGDINKARYKKELGQDSLCTVVVTSDSISSIWRE